MSRVLCPRLLYPTTQFCSRAGPNSTTMYSLYKFNVQQQDLTTDRTILYSTGLQNVCNGVQLVTLTAHSCPRCWTYSVIILTTASCHILSARSLYYYSTCSRAELGRGKWQLSLKIGVVWCLKVSKCVPQSQVLPDGRLTQPNWNIDI